jgi:hypothetical protein
LITGDTVKTDGKVWSMTPNSPDQMKAFLNQAPIAIAVDANSDEFNFHKGIKPIRGAACGKDDGHAVLAVGYGHDDTDNYDYVIIKNTYGTDWGVDGYGLISMEQTDAKDSGVCTIFTEGFFTKIETPILSRDGASKLATGILSLLYFALQ